MGLTTKAEVHFTDQFFNKDDPTKASLELAPFLFPGLGRQELDEADLSVTALSQGTTNALFKVSLRRSATVLVKVYGDGTEITIDRNKELNVHKLLSEKQLASSPLVRFANGHAYQFISGAVCSEGDMAHARIWRGVATELARWHTTLPVVGPSRGDPHKILDLKPGLWSTAKKWLDAIPAEPRGSATNKAELVEAFEYLTQKLLFGGATPEPMVLGHGDLLCGNIIVQDADPTNGSGPLEVAAVRFIDYEHATYCPRAFELANHFAEWAGFDCDYSLLPTTTTRRGFVREYLEAHKKPGMNGASELNGQLATEAEVDELMRQVDAFRGFPGFYWGLCALIQAEASTGTIDFDYGGYAERRFAEYRVWRQVEDGSVNGCGELPAREKRWAAM